MDIALIREGLRRREVTEPLFTQTVVEFLESIEPYLVAMEAGEDDYRRLARLLTPERVITFRVTWETDAGQLEHNIGYRVQFSSALGPYKGGLRFDSSVSLDVLQFLGFEQIFKNALTGLPLGGGKGGSDFNPKGKSVTEVRRFCRAFMTELVRHIGLETDVPAGDIGVSSRELGFMMGMYKELSNRADGVLTGKGVAIGGAAGRTEATGRGVVYFIEAVLAHHGELLVGKTAVVSGAGNVAIHVARTLVQKEVTVLTVSDRGGYLLKETGFTMEDLEVIEAHKFAGAELTTVMISGATYQVGTPWQHVAADLYVPCATQNELTEADAKAIVAAGGRLVAEGANMPTTASAVKVLHEARILFAPAKAANAGGVAVSGLEMMQNAGHDTWQRAAIEIRLQSIMNEIHATCVAYGTDETTGTVDYVAGANRGGFARVFTAMKELSW